MDSSKYRLQLAVHEVLFLTELLRYTSEYTEKYPDASPYLCCMISDVVDVNPSYHNAAVKYKRRIAAMRSGPSGEVLDVFSGHPALLQHSPCITKLEPSPLANTIRRYFRLGVVYQWLQDAQANIRLQQSILEDKEGSNARLE